MPVELGGNLGAVQSRAEQRIDLVAFVLGQVSIGHGQLRLVVKQHSLRLLACFSPGKLHFAVESAPGSQNPVLYALGAVLNGVAAMPKQVRTLSIYRKIISQLPEFRFVSPTLTDCLARALGFDGIPREGDSILPSPNGVATIFNAHGKEIVRRDLPMETRSRMINTSWQDWHGQTHHGIQTRDYEAYPRDLIPPPGEFLTAIRKNDQIVAASRVMQRDEDESDIVTLLNVFLECFKNFEIVRPDLTEYTEIRKINWKILPQGQYPFERARQALEEYLQQLSEDDRATATERIRGITRHNPDFVAIGLGGFSDYVVFGFTGRHRYVLESPNTGNATYVFRNEWEDFSQLSKREILQDNLQEARLVHNNRWHRSISDVINSP